mmetsp:Transcript_22064/g.44171  ORF Transcript_22064/g.44171 Transcript_22064/m.44171 type:complete len:110 (+) Transcript_22064:1069-1398(+)
MNSVIISDLGKLTSAFIASPATQQTASNPKYPKKEETAPRNIPDGPNSGGIMGVKFDGCMRRKPPTVMNTTKTTLTQVKKSVTILDSLTPPKTRIVVAIDTRHAMGLIP